MITVSSKLMKDIIQYIRDNLEYYSKLSPSDKKQMVLFLQDMSKKHNYTLTIKQFIEMRNVHMYILAKTKGTLANKYGSEIFTDYNNNVPIIKIAQKYKLPPMSVMIQILIELKFESHKIIRLIKHINKLPKPINDQLDLILKSDPISWINIPQINIYNMVKQHIDKSFIYDVNQKKGKRPIILFNEVITYKNKSFQWIVVKPYLLFDNKLLLNDANKVYNRFQRFGLGLILYKDIICSRSFINKLKVSVDVYKIFDFS